jgi:hypothetical protein
LWELTMAGRRTKEKSIGDFSLELTMAIIEACLWAWALVMAIKKEEKDACVFVVNCGYG